MVLVLRSSEGSGFPRIWPVKHFFEMLDSSCSLFPFSSYNFPFLIFDWLGAGDILLRQLLSDLVHSVEVSVSCGLLCFTSLLLHKGSLVPLGTLHIYFFTVDLIYFFCTLSQLKGLCTQEPHHPSLHVQNSLLLATPYLLQPSRITVRLQVHLLLAITLQPSLLVCVKTSLYSRSN